jgi:hypothetical protein
MTARVKKKRWNTKVETERGIIYFRLLNLMDVKDKFKVDLENEKEARGLYPIEQWILDIASENAKKDLNLKSLREINTVTLIKKESEAGGG